MRFRRSRPSMFNPPQPPAMRFIVDPDTDSLFIPIDFMGEIHRGRPRPPVGARPPADLPRTVVTGATLDSVEEAAASGRMNDLILDGADSALFEYHDLVSVFEYDLVPVPRLTLGMGPGGSDTFRFVNAVIIDWTTTSDYSPAYSNNELCEFFWDGGQHFLLEFLSFRIIVRAERLEVRGDHASH